MNFKGNTENQFYTPSISVHIPFSALKYYPMIFLPLTKLIGEKTRTHIESYELIHLEKLRFCIFGKWRDCLQAGRLLWYKLIRKTTIYVHNDWAEDLEKPLWDQRGKPFRQLYPNVNFKPLNEFNLFSICGVCWDVFKVRKELLKRCALKTINEQQMVSTKTEIIALQILNSIRTDINDGMFCSESIYSIRNSQLLQLITGSKSPSSVDQIETIRYPKEFIGHNVFTDAKHQNMSKESKETKEKISKISDYKQISKENPKSTPKDTSKWTANKITKVTITPTPKQTIKSESNVIKSNTLIEPYLTSNSHIVTEDESKFVKTIFPEVKQIQKELSEDNDLNMKTNEHKLIADRFKLLMNPQSNQESNERVWNKTWNKRNDSLKQQIVNNTVFESNKSEDPIKTQNKNIDFNNNHKKKD